MVKEEKNISDDSEEAFSNQSMEDDDAVNHDSPVTPMTEHEEVQINAAKPKEVEGVDIKDELVEYDFKEEKLEYDSYVQEASRNATFEDEKSVEEISHVKEVQKPDRQKRGLPDFDALIFMCNRWTKMDCFKFGVFGFPTNKQHTVEQVRQGMRLFLFELETKLLYGVFRAASPGGYKLEPKAYQDSGKSFPWQVRFIVYKECLPLPEQVFKEAIKENYEDEKRFKPELTGQQAQKLMKLFRPAPSGDKVFPAYPQPPLKVLPALAGKNSQLEQPNDPTQDRSSWRHLTRDKSPATRKNEDERFPVHSALDKSPLKQCAQFTAPSSIDATTEHNTFLLEKEKQLDLLEHAANIDIASSRFTYEAQKSQNDASRSSFLHGSTGVLEHIPSSLGSLTKNVNLTYMDLRKSMVEPSGSQLTHFRYLRDSMNTDSILSSGSTALGTISFDLHKPDPYRLNVGTPMTDPYGRLKVGAPMPDPYGHLNVGTSKADPYGLLLDTQDKPNNFSTGSNLGYKRDPYSLGLNMPSNHGLNHPSLHYQQVGALVNSGSLKASIANHQQPSLLGARREVRPSSLPDARLAGLGRPYAYESRIAGSSSHLGKRQYEDAYLTDLRSRTLLRQAHDDSLLNFPQRLPYERDARALTSLRYVAPTPPTYYNRNALEVEQPNTSRYNAMVRPYNRGFR